MILPDVLEGMVFNSVDSTYAHQAIPTDCKVNSSPRSDSRIVTAVAPSLGDTQHNLCHRGHVFGEELKISVGMRTLTNGCRGVAQYGFTQWSLQGVGAPTVASSMRMVKQSWTRIVVSC